jgi:hypothetical protein
LISLIGHSLGYWPHESLVCISLQTNRMGATLRLDLPPSSEHAKIYARSLAGHLGSDADATATVFAIFTDAPWTQQRREFLSPIIHEVAQQLAHSGMPIRAGWIVGPSSFAEYQPHTASYGPEVPLETVQSSCINAELIFRGSHVQSGLVLSLPRRRPTPEFEIDVETKKKVISSRIASVQTAQARALWNLLLEGEDDPTAAQLAELLAILQFPGLRDRLIADMPGLDLPMGLLLFGQSDSAPRWDRIDAAERLLLRLFSIASPQHAAAPLTLLGFIAWWKGRGSTAADFMDLALSFDPEYRLAQLMKEMLSCGLASGWARSKTQAYRQL